MNEISPKFTNNTTPGKASNRENTMEGQGTMPAGWYHGEGDPPGTKRYWDGSAWTGEPTVMSDSPNPSAGAGVQDSGLNPASAGKRLGGRVIDSILFSIPVAGVAISQIDFDSVVDAVEAGETVEVSGGNALWAVLVTLVIWLIEAAFVATLGATPGKLLVGTRIASTETRSTPPSWATAALRTAVRALGAISAISLALGNIVSGIVVLIGLASLVLLYTDDRRQTVMDKIAKTIVVDK